VILRGPAQTFQGGSDVLFPQLFQNRKGDTLDPISNSSELIRPIKFIEFFERNIFNSFDRIILEYAFGGSYDRT